MDNPTGPILVYGANGGQGSAVVRAALAAGRKVRVLLREGSSHPFGDAVEVARGDLADPASLARASAGVAGVYLMIPVRADRDEIVQWGRNAIDAAVEAGAGHAGLQHQRARVANGRSASRASMPSARSRPISGTRICRASRFARRSTWTISPSPGRRLRSFTMVSWPMCFPPISRFPGSVGMRRPPMRWQRCSAPISPHASRCFRAGGSQALTGTEVAANHRSRPAARDRLHADPARAV